MLTCTNLFITYRMLHATPTSIIKSYMYLIINSKNYNFSTFPSKDSLFEVAKDRKCKDHLLHQCKINIVNCDACSTQDWAICQIYARTIDNYVDLIWKQSVTCFWCKHQVIHPYQVSWYRCLRYYTILPVFIRMSLCSLLLIFFHAPNLIQAECTKSDESPSVTVWNSSHLHISWENAFRKCKDGHVERAYVKGSLDFGMALVNFSHGSITRKISPCSSYPDIRKVIQKDFAWDIPRRVNVVLGGG